MKAGSSLSVFREQELLGAMFEANNIIREPEPQYFSQLSMTSAAEVVGNHINIIEYACMIYIRELTK